MATKRKGRKPFNPGGEKGKLHRELHIPTDQKIPKERLAQAARSKDPEVARDAKRAQTMAKWHHTGPKGGAHKAREKRLAGKRL